MDTGFEGGPSEPIAVALPVPRRSGSALAAAIIVWFYALLGTILGLFMLIFDADPYAARNSDLWIGWVLLALGLGNVAFGVLLVRGLGWARIAVNVLAVFWFLAELYAVLWYAAQELTLNVWASLTSAFLNLVLLALLNNRRARTYFHA